MTNAPILVTGGTGTLGRHVVPRLLETGRHVLVLSRNRPEMRAGVACVTGDLATGEGIDAALEGVATIVHLAGSAKGDEEKARNLVESGSRAGVQHVVFISVVGADRIPVSGGIDRAMFGYFAEKLGAERAIAASGVPWTLLRATQFHDLVLTTVEQMTKLPVVPVPKGFRFQPVEPDEVAARLVELAFAAPAGHVADFGGPEIHELPQLVRAYLRARGRRRLLFSIPVPGKAAGAFRGGANLAPDRKAGRRTWDEFLEERFGAGRKAPSLRQSDRRQPA